MRNGYYVHKSTWFTKKRMIAMVQEHMYCPLYEHVRIKPCPNPPRKEFLIAEINKEIEKHIDDTVTWDMEANSSPPVDYLLNVLATLNPKHRYFGKNFTPDKSDIPNLDGKMLALKSDISMNHVFFKNLPLSLLLSRKKMDRLVMNVSVDLHLKILKHKRIFLTL